MAEYILREAVIEELERYGMEADGRAIIEAIPAADVRSVVRGKWIDEPITGGRRSTVRRICSICGINNNNRKSNFCPNCGADMREVSE